MLSSLIDGFGKRKKGVSNLDLICSFPLFYPAAKKFYFFLESPPMDVHSVIREMTTRIQRTSSFSAPE
jgi:hypothetical protein